MALTSTGTDKSREIWEKFLSSLSNQDVCQFFLQTAEHQPEDQGPDTVHDSIGPRFLAWHGNQSHDSGLEPDLSPEILGGFDLVRLTKRLLPRAWNPSAVSAFAPSIVTCENKAAPGCISSTEKAKFLQHFDSPRNRTDDCKYDPQRS